MKRKYEETFYENAFVEIVDEDLLNAKEKYIGHQCNCVSQKSKGLARLIFEKYPYSDTYKDERNPGTIKICDDGQDKKIIINMYAQRYPGNKSYKNNSVKLRTEWFKQCLDEIANIDGLKEIALPFNIGCGLAGGVWKTYLNMIENFARENQIVVKLYKHE